MKDSVFILPGDYIAGFVDGEGCFYLTYRSETKYNRHGKPRYFRWLPYFAITIREDDIEILKKIKNTLGCGNIYFLKRKNTQEKQGYYGVQNIDDLYNKVMPFFNKYKLRAKKQLDFNYWCKALEIIYKHKKEKRSYSQEEIKKLLEIRKEMRFFKSEMSRDYKNYPLGYH